MRRGRNHNKAKAPPEFRKSLSPIVVICSSTWTSHTESICSKTNQWQVFVHNPDSGKWWDRLQKNSRLRHGPPCGTKCHVIVVYDKDVHNHDNNNNNNNENNMNTKIHQAIKSVGEIIEIATVALLNEPPHVRNELEMAVSFPETIWTAANADTLVSSYVKLRELWTFHDTHENKQLEPLSLDQVPHICREWPPLKWRWNGPRLADLYQRLRSCKGDDFINEKESNSNHNEKNKDHLYQLRRELEEKARELLADADTQRVADLVLRQGVTRDESLFGRLHACALFSSATRTNTRYLVVASNPKSHEAFTLDAYRYATSQECTPALEQLRVVSSSELPREQFCIPLLVDNAMITASLIPALFPTGGEEGKSHDFDTVLGSHRCWVEHMALKACIVYLFQGSPGPLWDLSLEVVKSALPKTWELLMTEPPDEVFLRALLHPNVVEVGRLRRSCDNADGTTTQLLPWKLEVMSRIYALGRFVRTLDDKNMIGKDPAVCQAVASTMKVNPDQVIAIAHACKECPLNPELCANILQMHPLSQGDNKIQSTHSESMTPEACEVLGMLGVFLTQDRKSLKDASRIHATFEVEIPYTTSKALADCAMYCGTLRWLSKDDEEEEGIWTCTPCLHRWQKRGIREAYQTRKLMHPMKMTPFTRKEYYDPADWDSIMAATHGDISKLGVEFYWGKCSAESCGNVCEAVARSGACAETDGVPLNDFPETVVLNGGEETIQLRRSLEALGPLATNNIVTADCLEKYFDSVEKLMYISGPVRRRVRNCIDKSTYILPPGILCNACGGLPADSIDDYCPYCGTGFQPVFACVHYSCPECNKHFCKACKGIDGLHFNGVYSSDSHICWKVLGNRYSYHDTGFCAKCSKERPWPSSHALVSAGPDIYKRALEIGGSKGIPIQTAIEMQSSNLKAFTERYEEAVQIFRSCSHTVGNSKHCHCGDVDADEYDGGY